MNISRDSLRDALGLKPLTFSNIARVRLSRSGYAWPSKTFITRLPPWRSRREQRFSSESHSRTERKWSPDGSPDVAGAMSESTTSNRCYGVASASASSVSAGVVVKSPCNVRMFGWLN